MDEKRYIQPEEYLHDIWRLAAQVRRGGWRPDCLLALWRGGAPAGVAAHEFLKVSGWSMRHLPLKCCSYTGLGENGEVRFECSDEVFGAIAPGEKVLVVDDVFDTGRTVAAVAIRLAALGTDARFACVYWKPSRNETTMSPDYFAEKIEEWIVFPHEIEGLSPEEIRIKDPFLATLFED